MVGILEKEIWGLLKRLTKRLEKKFSFACGSIRLMTLSEDGWGFCESGHVAIKIRNHCGWLPMAEIIDSLVHELAHISDSVPGNHHDSDWAKRYAEYRKYLGL